MARVKPGWRVFRLEFQRAPEGGHGIFESALLEQGQAEVVLCLGDFRNLKCLPIHGDRLLKSADIRQRVAEGVAGGRIIRLDLNGPAPGHDGLSDQSFLPKRQRQIVAGLRVLRAKLERAAKRGDRLVGAALLPKCVAEVVVGHRVVRLEFDGAAAGGDGFGEFALQRQRVPEAVVRAGVAWLDLDGPPVGGDGLIQPPAFKEHGGEV